MTQWTSKENEELRRLYDELGPSWTEIGRRMGRSVNSLKNHLERLDDQEIEDSHAPVTLGCWGCSHEVVVDFPGGGFDLSDQLGGRADTNYDIEGTVYWECPECGDDVRTVVGGGRHIRPRGGPIGGGWVVRPTLITA